MPHESTAAVVIKTMDHGESNTIITFYSPERGKFAGVARGARRSKKRFVNKLELFTHLEIQYEISRLSSLVRVDQAELLLPFHTLRENYDRYVGASLICELVLHWTKENDAEPELYNLLVWALQGLNRGDSVSKTIIFFQSRLFDILGYRPQLQHCVTCGAIGTDKGPYRFSANKSGILCRKCRSDHVAAQFPISLNTAKLLNKALELPVDKLDRLKFSEASVREALQILQAYGHYILQKDIHSWRHLPVDNH